ncbi:50S ribosomal protein L22 [Candidatus Gottesmanbacteria bacterium RIFCSPHIGHO2_02_FULL_40_24]|uniref:Large ribosomal subunit protein uL22 n=2 Tax=Microgenomates group TaxID=1794810 RepID=A0A0H4T213_9BACT|nr:50S ribosomal protein L22, large subunit ribosomal protein L22 [uncultured Microgenomates bacterium Rifle_16ft_4_minimus_22956]OGG08048.1 MAG: 50S ribosomal protein L22 [Candidatus Gottesmanbacteria bacterium RIFCSPHIGHO2_01_FULL_40_15]OGG18218.1 MAG: 50S ribosomal protein L22 [Candidatus Gottesmanbacteria bacterium RIFCSPHIGHO2_02_FULL_40_24]OGG22886.1 MAG: 50S ribosomal protein L22 [Candidatus Gottesmanbacteria bacterium RIFCSPLOWO2_01_FULL_40_10]OGG23502.1 MAG: 50S ribosomal protein L22 [
METHAIIKYQRISPKKMKALSKLTVGLAPNKALDRLQFVPGKAARLLSQAVLSAKSNAVNNLKLNSTDLIIKEVIVNKGPILKRWQPVSRGMAHSIKKRTSHIMVKVVENKKVSAKKQTDVNIKPDEKSERLQDTGALKALTGKIRKKSKTGKENI